MSSKKIISYVYPQVIEEGTTELGQKYEVNYENGIKVLNSENANYSFGSLHQIMLKGIDEVLKKRNHLGYWFWDWVQDLSCLLCKRNSNGHTHLPRWK